MGSKLAALLGGPLKWAASLGTGALTAGVFWLLYKAGIDQGRTNALLFTFVTAAVAKLVGWVVATYGPKPTAPTTKPRVRKRRTPAATGNGPNRAEDLSHGFVRNFDPNKPDAE